MSFALPQPSPVEHRVGMQEEEPIAFPVMGASLKLRAAPTRRIDMRACRFGDGAGLVGRAAVDQDRLLHDAPWHHGRNQSCKGMRLTCARRFERRNDDRDHGAEPIGADGGAAIVPSGRRLCLDLFPDQSTYGQHVRCVAKTSRF